MLDDYVWLSGFMWDRAVGKQPDLIKCLYLSEFNYPFLSYAFHLAMSLFSTQLFHLLSKVIS